MFRSRIAEWPYQLGCISAAAAIIYRVLWVGGLGARPFGAPVSFLTTSWSSAFSCL
jgi:hypothetical protein